MSNYSISDKRPPVIGPNDNTRDKWEDTAKYLINPGRVTGRNKHDAGNLRHARPYISSGSKIFVFPIGVEGLRRSGTAKVSLHHWLNQNAVGAHVFHREEGRIELSGTFPGTQSQDNMTACINILRSDPPEGNLVLYCPGVFDAEQFVVAESWDFSHQPDDRTHSIDYTISLVIVGTGNPVTDAAGAPYDFGSTVRARGIVKYYTVTQSVRTLRQIALAAYHNADLWQRIVALNQSYFAGSERSAFNNMPTYKLASYRWPIGTKFRV